MYFLVNKYEISHKIVEKSHQNMRYRLVKDKCQQTSAIANVANVENITDAINFQKRFVIYTIC